MKLKEIRKQKGFTQKELAEKVGVDTSSISKYETGVAEPSYDVLKKLAEVLSVSIDSFSDVAVETDNSDLEILEFLKNNESFKILFDQLKNSKSEDIDTLIAIHNAMRETNINFR